MKNSLIMKTVSLSLLLLQIHGLCMDNCVQCNGGGCATCRDSFYVTKGLVCQGCSEEGCQVCPNDTCTQCLNGYQFENQKCYQTGQGRLYLIIGMIFIIMISVIFLFILLWKWKTIASFFSSHETELQRMKKAEKDGASWVTTVMAHNKVFPLKAEVDIDDSRVEINSRQADTLGDQKSIIFL